MQQRTLIDAGARCSRALPDLRGRSLLARRVRRWTSHHEFDFIVTMENGVTVKLPAQSSQSWEVAFTGRYDDHILTLLTPFIEPESVVLDIGASLGLYTVGLAVRARPIGAELIAIEPVPTNCDVIRYSIDHNALVNVSVLEVAVGSKSGTLTMAVESTLGGNATVTTDLSETEKARHLRSDYHASVQVPVVTLDGLQLPGDRRCSLVKMDVEGFEMETLRGATDFVRRHRPVIFGEFSGAWMASRGEPPTAIRDWATTNGYRVAGVDRIPRRFTVGKAVVGPRDTGDDLILTPLE